MLKFAGFPLSAWTFALRTWAAMMLALYVAFWLQPFLMDCLIGISHGCRCLQSIDGQGLHAVRGEGRSEEILDLVETNLWR